MSQFESENERNEFEPEKFENADSENAEFERARFEAELTLALRQVEAPEGFAERVLAKATEAEPRKAKVLQMPRRVQVWVGGAVAAALMVAAVGIHRQHVRQQRAEEAAQAQQQLELALQITGETLANVRAQMRQAGVPVGD
ncbi:MAG TPA: hypothetical protein VII58_08240 [Acidobacteriaceae bacterium]